MKKTLALVFALVFGVIAASGQVTPNLGFRVPTYNSPNWNVPMNYNFTLMDELLSGSYQAANVAFTYRPIFSNSAPVNSNCSASNNGQNYYYNNGLGVTVYACQASASAWVIIGFQNPMNSLGDMIYGGNSVGSPVRLGIGTTGQVLTVNASGIPQWQTSSASFPYPAAGIPTSTGSAWGSSYSTIGGGLYLPLVPALGGSGQVLTINSSGALDWEGSGGITYPASGVVTSTGSAFGTSLQTTGGGSLLPLVPTLGSNGQYLGINGGVLAWLNSPGFANPMTASGDLIYGGSGGTATRLPVGSNGQILTLSGGLPVWANNSALTNPMSTIGDMIYSTDNSGTPGRLAAGTSGYVLTANGAGALPSWQAGFTNPMSTTGDLIVGGSTGTPTRLGIGTSGQILTSNGTGPVWSNNTSLTNPMSAQGDIIYGAAGGSPTRLAAGTAGQVLQTNGSSANPSWVTPFANPMTSNGDMIFGGSGGTPSRLGVGSNGQFLSIVSGTPQWAAAPGFTNPMTTAGDIIYGAAGGSPTRLAAGTSGDCLISNGTAAPTWGACGSGGASAGQYTSVASSTSLSISNAAWTPIITTASLTLTPNAPLNVRCRIFMQGGGAFTYQVSIVNASGTQATQNNTMMEVGFYTAYNNASPSVHEFLSQTGGIGATPVSIVSWAQSAGGYTMLTVDYVAMPQASSVTFADSIVITNNTATAQTMTINYAACSVSL